MELANRLTAAVMDVLALDANAISVAVEDVPAQRWMQQVYVPDIGPASASSSDRDMDRSPSLRKAKTIETAVGGTSPHRAIQE